MHPFSLFGPAVWRSCELWPSCLTLRTHAVAWLNLYTCCRTPRHYLTSQSFDSIVSSTIELSSPGVSTVDYASLPYKYLQRPIWPLDQDFTWSAVEAEAQAQAERLAAHADLVEELVAAVVETDR